MTAQRLLKIFAFLSLIATVAAAVSWYESGLPPPSWLIRTSIGAFVAALLTAFIGADTRPRLMLRFLAALFALLAVIAFAADISMARPGGATGSASLLDHLDNFAPALVASIKANLTRALGPAIWDPVLVTFLSFPAYLIFLALAICAGFAGRPRRRVQIFIN